MKLPNSTKAVVEREKIVAYLLDATHPDNGGKARFFESLGFRRNQWAALATALQTLAGGAEVTASAKTAHGRKYVMVGKINSPSGKSPLVMTVWIVDSGADSPRLVTAYPHEE